MRARAAGLLDRFTDDNFNPDRAITRIEMANILAAILRYHRFAQVPTERFMRDFTDASSINSGTNTRNAALVYEHGIMQGMPGARGMEFRPNGTTTRAQAATVQIRLLEVLGFIE
jgi:hypothetical protein